MCMYIYIYLHIYTHIHTLTHRMCGHGGLVETARQRGRSIKAKILKVSFAVIVYSQLSSELLFSEFVPLLAMDPRQIPKILKRQLATQ